MVFRRRRPVRQPATASVAGEDRASVAANKSPDRSNTPQQKPRPNLDGLLRTTCSLIQLDDLQIAVSTHDRN